MTSTYLLTVVTFKETDVKANFARSHDGVHKEFTRLFTIPQKRMKMAQLQVCHNILYNCLNQFRNSKHKEIPIHRQFALPRMIEYIIHD